MSLQVPQLKRLALTGSNPTSTRLFVKNAGQAQLKINPLCEQLLPAKIPCYDLLLKNQLSCGVQNVCGIKKLSALLCPCVLPYAFAILIAHEQKTKSALKDFASLNFEAP